MGQGKSRKKNVDEESLLGLKKTSDSECNSTVMIYIHRCGLEYKESRSDDKIVGKWNDLLEDLATNLLPDIDYYQRGILMASRIFSIIKCCRNDVFRAKIGGSVGKHIGISTRSIPTQKKEFNSEFDLYVFLINKKPPFEKVIEEFKDHLETFKKFLPGFCLLSQNESSGNANCLEFTIENKCYHLYPAINFVDIIEFEAFSNMDPIIQTCITETKRFVEVQKLEALREIETVENFQGKSLFFSSLEESSVRYYKTRPRYIRQVIRLVRYWNHNINCHLNLKTIDRNKSRSVMLDLCAIKAALICSSESLYDILRKVMELLMDFRNLCIIFQVLEGNIAEYDEMKISLSNGKLAVLMDFPSPIGSASASNKDASIGDIERISLVQKTIFHSMPCVLDPCNPFNNLADIDKEDWEILRKNANEILTHLDENIFQNDEMIHKIFEND